MTKKEKTIVTEDRWAELRRFTDARISLGRCGPSLPLDQSLAFKLDHAKARDAVRQPMDAQAVAAAIRALGQECLILDSMAVDKDLYLTRPDLGRTLCDASRELLAARKGSRDLCLVVGDGLSARAVHENAVPFLQHFLALAAPANLTLAPICLVRGARVAIADEIAHLLGARLAAICIGERPGLSSPNSLGVYMTFGPKPGTTDEARNCISNIRDAGLPAAQAARKLAYLVEHALSLGFSGVHHKDKMPPNYLPFTPRPPSLTD